MDVLSDVLSSVRLQGALFFNAEFSAPWCLSSSGAAGIAPYLPSKNAHLIMFHFLTEGRAYASLPGGERLHLEAGDIVILPHGEPHLIGNGYPQKPVDSFRTFAKNLSDGLKAVRYGGGGEVTRFVCGYMACDSQLCEVLMMGLPRIFKVSVATDESGHWIENSIRFSVGESTGPAAGSSLVVGKLSEVLFVETLRRYIATIPPNQTGWLAGLRDPMLARALAELHRQPAKDWTVASLAKMVGLSRTRLVERFRHYLKTSPIAYLTSWRMKLSAEALRSTQKTVAEVAYEAGYLSEAAFNRAFKRAFNAPPAQFRQLCKASTAKESKAAQRKRIVA
ncbi:MAG TPA: AraC family transcriptional regulator [Terracidiphilus sp.]|nr:AraC family transcriptional regulator [Terracidiphilus sp.]